MKLFIKFCQFAFFIKSKFCGTKKVKPEIVWDSITQSWFCSYQHFYRFVWATGDTPSIAYKNWLIEYANLMNILELMRLNGDDARKFVEKAKRKIENAKTRSN